MCWVSGMLGCMRRAFDLLREHKDEELGHRHDSGRGSGDLRHDPEGRHGRHFQIESRAQMAMLPRLKPRGQLREDRLRVLVDEAPSPRRLLRGTPQRTADGLLRARPDRARRARARRRGPSRLRQREPMGLHARTGGRALQGRPARNFDRFAAWPTCTAPRSSRRGATRPTDPSRRSGAARASRRPRSSAWRRRMPSTRSARTDARESGR
jgi:hypothetical protein